MAKINQQLILRMVDHGYADEDIAGRLRYDIEIVRAVREKSQNYKYKLELENEKNKFNR